LTPHHLRIAAELLDFHRCPNTGRVLHSTKGDDKAFCRCGETPPVHLKEFMARATVDDFVEQELWSGVVDRHALGFAEPTSNPTSGPITYVKDGQMWCRTSDGHDYPCTPLSEEDE
jgi:hypothetical protein